MQYILRNFLRISIIGIIIILFTALRQWHYGMWSLMNCFQDFIGSFLIIFAIFKLVHLKHFVEAYRIYDIIAQKNILYAYAYPCIELCLGIAYIIRFVPIVTNSITLILMLISSIGVIIELRKRKKVTCACLQEVFKLPMTYVTLVENVIIALMATTIMVLSQ